ncbi:MAG: TIGR04376 family protein [Kovacikia sp.]
MGLFDDFSRFLEEQLDEYLRNNPHLELFVLEEKLREQEEETLTLMTDLKRQEKQCQDEIMGIAREIQLWHARIGKAKAANRLDLVEPAQAHEASLLRQGNQKWGQMEMLKERIQQTQELQKKIGARRKELQTKVTEAQAVRGKTNQSREPLGWNPASTPNSSNLDALEKQFRRWEAEEELEQLKRNLGR